MDTLLVALGSFLGFIIAYNTYGRWLARKVFNVDPQAVVPSHELRDDVDFVPTRRSVIFGHHFTSIAGTGPIVGPAIAVFWGWLPALLWVVFGSIFIGAVHDFGALMVSLRNRGQTVGEIAGRLISPRASVIFLLILFFALNRRAGRLWAGDRLDLFDLSAVGTECVALFAAGRGNWPVVLPTWRELTDSFARCPCPALPGGRGRCRFASHRFAAMAT